MPREIALLDALVPTLLLAFLASIVLHTVLDRILGCCGVYRHVWHPSLFRIGIFVCIFALCGLLTLR